MLTTNCFRLTEPTNGSSNEVDLFADFMDEPAPDVDTYDADDGTPDTDLFQDAAFVSASATEHIPQNEVHILLVTLEIRVLNNLDFREHLNVY